MPGALFPGDYECQDYAALVGFIIGIVCGVACLCGGLAYFFLKTSTPQRQPTAATYGDGAYQEGGMVAAVGGMVAAAY